MTHQEDTQPASIAERGVMDKKPVKVFLGVPADDGSRPKFWIGLLKLFNFASQPENAWLEFHLEMIPGDSLVSRARNNLANTFARSSCDFLFFIDTDIVFRPEHVFRLFEQPRDVFCGLYPKKQPTLDWVANGIPGEEVDPKTRMQKVAEAGTGFMAISQRALEAYREAYPERRYDGGDHGETHYEYFPVGIVEEKDRLRYMSEDWYFCHLIRKLGIDIYVNTAVQVKHEGWVEYPLPQDNRRLLKVAGGAGMEHCRDVLEGCYDVSQYAPLVPPIVLDIGGNVGAFAAWALARWEGCSVYSYEPHPENFAKLEAFAEGREIVALNYAVRENEGEGILLDGRNNCGEASFHDIGEQHVERSNVVQCLAAKTLPRADVLKLDTEGCELEILRALADADRLSGVSVIAVEYHRECDVRQIVGLLEGFSIAGAKAYHKDRGLLRFLRSDLLRQET